MSAAMPPPSIAEALEIVRKLGVHSITGESYLAEFGLRFMREAEPKRYNAAKDLKAFIGDERGES